MKLKKTAKFFIAAIGAVTFTFLNSSIILAQQNFPTTVSDAQYKMKRCEAVESSFKKIKEKIAQIETDKEREEKQAGITAFEEAVKTFKKGKAEYEEQLLKNLSMKQKENEAEAQKILDKGIVHVIREQYKKINQEHLITPEMEKALKAQEEENKQYAKAILKGPEFCSKYLIKKMGSQGAMYGFDDKSLDLIEEKIKVAKKVFGIENEENGKGADECSSKIGKA